MSTLCSSVEINIKRNSSGAKSGPFWGVRLQGPVRGDTGLQLFITGLVELCDYLVCTCVTLIKI